MFGYDSTLDIRKGLEYAMEFELLYLKNKASLYTAMATEDSVRINMMEQRLGKIRSN